jgi:hypothetical protein
MPTLSEGAKNVILMVLTLLLVGMMFFLFQFIKSIYDKGHDKMVAQSAALTQAEFDAYRGKFLTGSEIITTINQYKSTAAFAIKVVTGNNNTGFYMQNGTTAGTSTCFADPGTPSTPVNSTVTSCSSFTVYDVPAMQDTATPLAYVNPTGRFQGQVYSDSSNEIRLVVFTQR